MGVFLHHEEVTWQTYFKVMYPVIITEGKVETYAPLTTLFRALSVGAPAAASVNTTQPAPPPHSANIARGYKNLIKR